jgi:SAM-dependent methyltransferase
MPFRDKGRADIPMPPVELRKLVGPLDDNDYDNPDGRRIWGELAFHPLRPGEAYRRVFDFGCGCGRQARQLMLQRQPPESYVGIDINREMIKWARKHLGRSNVKFEHHNVWHPIYAPYNERNRQLPIREYGSNFTLINAHSVFTHLLEDQARFYLNEMRSMLAPHALLRTSWFLLNCAWFPVLAPHQHCVYVNHEDPTQAVYYDWFFISELIHELGFKLLDAEWARVSGYQSVVMLGWGPEFVENRAVVPPDTILGFGYSEPRHRGEGYTPIGN